MVSLECFGDLLMVFCWCLAGGGGGDGGGDILVLQWCFSGGVLLVVWCCSGTFGGGCVFVSMFLPGGMFSAHIVLLIFTALHFPRFVSLLACSSCSCCVGGGWGGWHDDVQFNLYSDARTMVSSTLMSTSVECLP